MNRRPLAATNGGITPGEGWNLWPIRDVAIWIVPTVPIAAAAWLRRPKEWLFLGTRVIGIIAELVNNTVGLMTFFVLLAWQRGTVSPDG